MVNLKLFIVDMDNSRSTIPAILPKSDLGQQKWEGTPKPRIARVDAQVLKGYTWQVGISLSSPRHMSHIWVKHYTPLSVLYRLLSKSMTQKLNNKPKIQQPTRMVPTKERDNQLKQPIGFHQKTQNHGLIQNTYTKHIDQVSNSTYNE